MNGERIKRRIRREAFQPTWLGLLISPVFIIRHGLYAAIRQLAPRIGGNVLDFGCGSKPYEALFVNASRYRGCDIETSGHDHENSRVDFYYNGRRLPCADQEFDAVVSFETFEHVFNLPEMLLEINRVTRLSGYLLVTVPFAWGEHEQPFDFARYTSFGITRVLNDGGYEVLTLIKTATYLLAIFQLLIAYLTQHVLPKGRIFYVFQLLLIFPLTAFAYSANALLPKRDQFFCNAVVLARKVR